MTTLMRSTLSFVLILGFFGAAPAYADDPTSQFISLPPLASSLPPGATGQTIQLEVWSQANGGSLIYSEAHTIDTDAGSNITNDTGLGDLLLGRPNGLYAGNFPYGSSRYLDASLAGMSLLAGRIPFYGSIFAMTSSGNFSGNITMVDSTATGGNLLKGGYYFMHNYGPRNTFLGQSAGAPPISGADNTGVGFYALRADSSGANNTAVGSDALGNNTMGNNNTASGYHALETNSAGHDNTGLGYRALQANTASYNTASGSGALQANTTGQENTAQGFNALNLNTTGSQNTAAGSGALYSNIAGHDNTAYGYHALLYATGSNNTASGSGALQANTTGEWNTASGVSALHANQTGVSNTADGYSALADNVDGYDNTAIGYNAGIANTSGNYNTAIGMNTLLTNVTGSYNTAVGANAGLNPGIFTPLQNTTAIGYGATVNASNKIRLGNYAVTVIEGAVGFTSSSDRTKKENFRPVDGQEVLEKIRKLALTSWNFIGHDPARFRHYGPMAQDFFAAFGHDGVGTVGTPTTITTTDIDGILMIAAQALEQRTSEHVKKLEALEAKGLRLEAENAELRARLEALERGARGP